jgi:FkbM family methyltransferase
MSMIRQGKLMKTPPMQAAIAAMRKVWYAGRDEELDIAGYKLRYVPGTRPVRPAYKDDSDLIVRNDARQLLYFAENIQRGDTVFDVGANVGQYAVLFGAIVGPAGKVFSFEPDLDSRSLLERNVALNRLESRVKIEPLALFDEIGTHAFYSRSGDAMNSLERAGLGSNSTLSDVRESIVHTIPLDDYLVSNGLPDPDWLKIDAEGAEINVLRGARRALHGKTKIICELHPYAWQSFGTSYAELETIVAQAGRKITSLDGEPQNSAQPHYGAVVISW